MRPTLFEIAGEPVPAYFAMLMLGFALATWLGVRWAKNQGLDHEVVIDLGLYSVIWGVAGARLLHVLADGYFWDYVHLCTNPALVQWKIPKSQCLDIEGLWNAARHICQPRQRDCFAWLAFWRGGLTYYGGLLASVVWGGYFVQKEHFPLRKGLDMAGLTIPVGLVVARLGCFLGGCCFGTVTDSACGVRFPAWSSASEMHYREGLLKSPALPSLPVHPTQLYEAVGCAALALVLWFAVEPKKRFDGQVFLISLMGYALLRFGLEFLRADDRGSLVGLSTSQWIGLAVLAICLRSWKVLQSHPPKAS